MALLIATVAVVLSGKRPGDLVDLGKVVREHLLDSALLLRFLFECVQVLQQQISY
jgi:hypothetical protein